MPLIQWEDKYSFAIPAIDSQHKTMFEIINRLFDRMHNLEDKDVLNDVLKELKDYADMHFATEEKYFREFGYEKGEEHTALHEAYKVRLNEFLNRHDIDKQSLSYEILDFLEDWWLGHIAKADREYIDCFKNHGL
jgi:hemerythrin-like metal-binding protein